MARKMTEWPSKRGPITKIMPSDGCIGDTVPLAVGKWYDFHEFGWYMGNVGSIISCVEIAMKTAALLKITTFLPVIAMLALLGCGGGGGVRDTARPVPPSDETERFNTAISRAQAAENAALSSAAQAALQCQKEPAACQAAEDATTAALLAEGANERAQNAMTADEAERAAEVAEQGASRAATAAADAVRLAAAGTPEQPPEPPTTGGTPEWLLPGSVASAAARDETARVIRATQEISPNLYSNHGYISKPDDYIGPGGG